MSTSELIIDGSILQNTLCSLCGEPGHVAKDCSLEHTLNEREDIITLNAFIKINKEDDESDDENDDESDDENDDDDWSYASVWAPDSEDETDDESDEEECAICERRDRPVDPWFRILCSVCG